MTPTADELVVAVEWLKKDESMPRSMSPGYGAVDEPNDAFCWPNDWEKKTWYRYKWFKTISEAQCDK